MDGTWERYLTLFDKVLHMKQKKLDMIIDTWIRVSVPPEVLSGS